MSGVRESAIVIPVAALRRVFVMLLVLIAVVGAIVVLRTQVLRAPGGADAIDRSGYQSVLLANGATMFGKLQPQGDDWFVMTDVYYLVTTESGTPQLVKRGTEAQGPREPLIVPRAQIIYIENMRDDSDIVSLIKRFKSGQLPATSIPPATARPSPSATR